MTAPSPDRSFDSVSVVIPYQNHGPMLDECLDHLARQTYRAFDVILVPDGDETIAGENVRVLARQPGLPNHKRLAAAHASDAAILAFIDDDAYPDPGWLAAALAHFADPAVIAAGGPSVTPPEDSPRRRAGGAVFASPLVTSVTRHRYLPQPVRDVDALPTCNLLIRRDAFIRHAGPSLPYWPGEDILVCLGVTSAGGRIVYDPAALVYHHRRPLFAAHLRQVWAYARFRGFFLRQLNRSSRNIIYAAPAAFAIAHGLAAIALARPRLRVPVALGAACYVVAVAASARSEARSERVNPWVVAAGIYLTHLAYGIGTIRGWLERDGPRGR